MLDGAPDDTPNSSNQRKIVCREIAQWDQLFNRVAKLRPDEPCLFLGRAANRTLHDQWEEAAADYARVIASRPIEFDDVAYASVLLLLDASKTRYQHFCNEMVSRFDEPPGGYEANIMARVCALGPAADVESATVLRWAAVGVEKESGAPQLHSLGLAQYRAGKYEEAIQSIVKSKVAAPAWSGISQNWLVMAMAHYQLGDVNKANECLATAREVIEEPRKAHALGSYPIQFGDWAELQVLMREAENLQRSSAADGGESSTDD